MKNKVHSVQAGKKKTNRIKVWIFKNTFSNLYKERDI